MARDKKMMDETVGLLYNTKKPADALDGLGSGLGNMGKGVLAGFADIGAMTAVGAKAEGAKGAAKGFGTGLLAGVGLIAGGIGTGCYQIGRGIGNTPDAIKAKKEGKEWDPETRTWIIFNLKEEAKLLEKSDEDYV